jgi:murein DD-endopeptidase MepM/ murein hydrolase activator NlpD
VSTLLKRLVCSVLCGCVPAGAFAQLLYRYQDENGVWVYADRAPDTGVAVESMDLGIAPVAAEVKLLRRDDGLGTAILAANTFWSPVQVAYEVLEPLNVAVAHGGGMRGNRILEPRSETLLLDLVPIVPARETSFDMRLQYIPGRPGVEHRPDQPYRLPFALATGYRVSQAFPSGITHADASSIYAVDFAMPIGTGVYAARGGIVIQIADEYYAAGLDPDTDLARANIVRVLHDDGTMSLYAHLNWNSIRVRPGQRVARGEYIADSGNTGFSTGPHLHFVVQRNAGGLIESVPVTFAGPGGEPIVLETGDFVTAR